MSISVCMMVKDEEKHLPRCLASVAELNPAEIVILDTGSTDRTIEIAESYGAKVIIPDDLESFFVDTIHGPKLNFSKARNYVHSFAAGTWIVSIDADEVLVPTEGHTQADFTKFLNDMPEDMEAAGCIMDDIQKGRVKASMMMVRFFRNGKVRYHGIVHNEARWPSYPDKAANVPVIMFRHFGYDGTDKEKLAKWQRLEGLLRRRIEDDPEDWDALYYLNQALLSHKGADGLDEAIALGERYALNREKIMGFMKGIYASLAQCLLYKDEIQRAMDWIQVGLRDHQFDLDLNWLVMRIANKIQNPQLLATAANNFIVGYETFDKWIHKEGGRAIYHRTVEDYSQALFYSGFSAIEIGMKQLEKLRVLIPQLSHENQDVIFSKEKAVWNDMGLTPQKPLAHSQRKIVTPNDFKLHAIN